MQWSRILLVVGLCAAVCTGGCGVDTIAMGNVQVLSITSPVRACISEPMVLEGVNFLSEHGATVTVRFEAMAGTPFEGGTAAIAEVTGTVMDNSTIELMSPVAIENTSAMVTVILPGGASGTSTEAISELAGGFLGPPSAVNDNYEVIGNVQIVVSAAAGVLQNDEPGTCEPLEPQGARSATATGEEPHTHLEGLSVLSFDAVSAEGGEVTVNPDGSFEYNPPAGYRGTDTFTYTMTNGTQTSSATVTTTINEMVWFIDDQSPSGGDGRFTSPLGNLFDFEAIQGGLAGPGDIIFIYHGTGLPYDGGVSLLDRQMLVGEGLGLTVLGQDLVAPGQSPVLTNSGIAFGDSEVVAHCVILANQSSVVGLDIDGPTGAGIMGDSISGPIEIDRVTIRNTGTEGIFLDSCDGRFDVGLLGAGAVGDVFNAGGAGVRIRDFGADGIFNFNGSIYNDNDVLVSIDTTAAGSQVNFNTTGTNVLSASTNPNGAIFIFGADGDLTFTTPLVATNPGFSAIFGTDGGGTWSFTDVTITGQTGLNGCIDVFANSGTLNFTDLTLSTNAAGTNSAVTGFLIGGNNIVNVLGANNTVVSDGGAAIAVIDVTTINMTWQTVTSTNNLSTQLGFAGDDGIDLLNIANGTFNVTGTTTVNNADGVALSVSNVGAAVTLATFNADTIGTNALITGVASNNAGTITINGGTISNVTQAGLRIGSSGFGNGSNVTVSNTSFTSIGGFIVEAANSTLGGSGNTATPFSCSDGGGNTGTITFNGGADSCP
jgi:hypothetical protein